MANSQGEKKDETVLGKVKEKPKIGDYDDNGLQISDKDVLIYELKELIASKENDYTQMSIELTNLGKANAELNETIKRLSDDLSKVTNQLTTLIGAQTINSKNNPRKRANATSRMYQKNYIVELNTSTESPPTKITVNKKTVQRKRDSSASTDSKQRNINEMFSQNAGLEGGATTSNSSITTNTNTPILTVNNVDSTPATITVDDDETISNDVEIESEQNINAWSTVNFKNKKSNNIKIQPFQVMASDEIKKSLINTLKHNLPVNSFTVENRNKCVRIFPSDEIQAKAIEELISQRGYEFHTYVNKNDKQKGFILKGLEDIYTVEEIQSELKHILNVRVKVLPFVTGFQRANADKIAFKPFYKVIFESTFDENLLLNVRSILSISIKWEKIKKSNVTQCHRCQRYFHTTAGCGYHFRCVKCGENHKPGDCPVDSMQVKILKCANCGGSHNANNHKECKYFAEKIAPVIEKNKKIERDVTKNISVNSKAGTIVSSGNSSSFASIVRGINSKNHPSKSTTSETVSSTNIENSLMKLMDKIISPIATLINNQNKLLEKFVSQND